MVCVAAGTAAGGEGLVPATVAEERSRCSASMDGGALTAALLLPPAARVTPPLVLLSLALLSLEVEDAVHVLLHAVAPLAELAPGSLHRIWLSSELFWLC